MSETNQPIPPKGGSSSAPAKTAEAETPKSRTPEADRLHEILSTRFGQDWRSKVDLSVTVRDFYWVVRLAEIGVDTMNKEFRDEKGRLDASSSMSIVSWRTDIHELVNQIETAKVTKKKK